MPNFNPTFPDNLGPEWFLSHNQVTDVFAGSPARWQRLPSTLAETITALRLSAQVNPSLRASVPTLIDIVPEGAEQPAPFELLSLAPSADVVVGGWRTDTGAATNLFQAIDEATDQWHPGAPAQASWIQNTTPFDNYECRVNASAFAGALANARIGWVAIQAILGMNTGFGKLRVNITIGGVNYEPAGSNLREVNGYGKIIEFWYGELNPATNRPWTPADIALFSSSSSIKIRSQEATAGKHPRVYAVALNVQHVPVENRVAVGIWRRPENIGTSRLLNITTDDLRSLPSGAAGWSKPTGVNHLYSWRQSVSPSQYGSVVADDVRWNGAFQDMGPGGKPPGIVYPLYHLGTPPPPSTVLASDRSGYDPFGRPDLAFAGRNRSAYGLALVRSDAAHSVDSQPYRLDLTDLFTITSATKAGQRVTPASTQTYIGVRLPIVPPATGNPTLTVSVHLVSSGAQVGGTFQTTAAAVRALPAAEGGLRYVTGFLSASATLTGGTAYEIRVSTSSGSWIVLMPDCSLAPTTSFGGSTNGAFRGATHDGNRDLLVNLIKQPTAPTIGAAVTVHPVAITVCSVDEVQHVTVTGTPSPVGNFLRLELERQLDGGDWVPIRYFSTEDPVNYVDRGVPRGASALYRLRSVARDGRISAWATTVTPAVPVATNAELILTSDHRPELEIVLDYDPESSYPVLSNERDEKVPIEGLPYQVVFMERVSRGVGWATGITLNFGDSCPPELRGGMRVFQPLLDLIRAGTNDDPENAIPYVIAMDHQGTRVLGHVEMSEPQQAQPLDRYRAEIDVTPTHVVEIPVED